MGNTLYNGGSPPSWDWAAHCGRASGGAESAPQQAARENLCLARLADEEYMASGSLSKIIAPARKGMDADLLNAGLPSSIPSVLGIGGRLTNRYQSAHLIMCDTAAGPSTPGRSATTSTTTTTASTSTTTTSTSTTTTTFLRQHFYQQTVKISLQLKLNEPKFEYDRYWRTRLLSPFDRHTIRGWLAAALARGLHRAVCDPVLPWFFFNHRERCEEGALGEAGVWGIVQIQMDAALLQRTNGSQPSYPYGPERTDDRQKYVPGQFPEGDESELVTHFTETKSFLQALKPTYAALGSVRHSCVWGSTGKKCKLLPEDHREYKVCSGCSRHEYDTMAVLKDRNETTPLPTQSEIVFTLVGPEERLKNLRKYVYNVTSVGSWEVPTR